MLIQLWIELVKYPAPPFTVLHKTEELKKISIPITILHLVCSQQRKVENITLHKSTLYTLLHKSNGIDK